MAIKFKRQTGDTGVPDSLNYGEPAVAKDGTLYIGNENNLPINHGVAIYTHTYDPAAHAHTLVGTGDNIKFIATANFTSGDTFIVNGITSTGQTQNGELLDDEYFKTGGVVQCFKNGDVLNFKSGGAALNFKVVGGTTQPLNPKENTIWVNTDVEIPKNGFIFSKEQPTTNVIGTVWFKTNNYSGSFFNALKKGKIEIYIHGPMQWTGTNWAYKKGEIFQSNIWNSLDTYIYFWGKEFISFKASPWAAGSAPCTIIKNSDNILVKTNGTYAEGGIILQTKINLTAYNKISAVISSAAASQIVNIIVKTQPYTSGLDAVATTTVPLGLKVLKSLDVTTLTGDYFIVISRASPSPAGDFNVYEWYLE